MREPEEQEEYTEEQLQHRRNISTVYASIKGLVTDPAWASIIEIEARLRDEIAHGAMKADGSIEYWRGRYDGTRGLLLKINEIVEAGATIEAEARERLASEKLKREILDKQKRDSRRPGDLDDVTSDQL